MLFNSYAFLFLFLPITLTLFFIFTKRRLQLGILFAASIFFYCYWSTTYVFVMLLTVVLDFYVARSMGFTLDPKKRKALLLFSVICNLSILGYFKYFNFFAGVLHDGLNLPVPYANVILPIGISFYTFQSMSYVIDVYRKTSSPHAKLLEFAGYVTFFPHQISGPLVRHNVIVPQLENQKTYRFQWENFWKGCNFFIFGLAKKVLLADLLAGGVDAILGSLSTASTLEAWLALLGFSLQLYFDFSGYSDMAVGLGLMMNIRFPQNFNSPYKSHSITEFWQRWHITLSSWLRDYLYIPLGGNRRGRFNTYRNLLMTMAIGGFWHGANWTYILWGLFHGGLLAIERLLKDHGLFAEGRGWLALIKTFLLVNLGWILFRSPNMHQAGLWLTKLLPGPRWREILLLPDSRRDQFFAAFALALGIAFLAKNTWQMTLPYSLRRAFGLAFLFVTCLMFMGEKSPFLYFQF